MWLVTQPVQLLIVARLTYINILKHIGSNMLAHRCLVFTVHAVSLLLLNGSVVRDAL